MKNKKTIRNVLILAGIAVTALFFINISFASSDGKVIRDENGKWFIDTEIPIFTEDREYIHKLVDLD